MKRLLAIFVVLLASASASAAPIYIDALYDRCTLSVKSKNVKIKTHHRNSLCTISKEIVVCFTKGGGTVNRSYLPGKVKTTKVNGAPHAVILDGTNAFYFNMKSNFTVLLADFDIKGTKGQLFCQGQYRFIKQAEFMKTVEGWTKEQGRKKDKNAGRTI